MRAADEGIKSEALRAALELAVAGKPERLEDLLCRYGGGADPRPNLRLAAALAVELAASPRSVVRLLSRFGTDDAAPDTARVFLPMAAAHGWVALLRAARETEVAWAALAELAADERPPVRVATLDALATFALGDDGALALVTTALDWFSVDDLQSRFSAAALVIEVLRDRRVVTALADRPELLAYLARALDELASAPRSTERLEGRRRLVTALPPTLATVVATLGAGDRGPAWLTSQCENAQQPNVRGVLSDTLLHLRRTSLGHGSATAQRLRRALEGSAKPLRDPTRLRPGSGRGKSSRRVR